MFAGISLVFSRSLKRWFSVIGWAACWARLWRCSWKRSRSSQGLGDGDLTVVSGQCLKSAPVRGWRLEERIWGSWGRRLSWTATGKMPGSGRLFPGSVGNPISKWYRWGGYLVGWPGELLRSCLRLGRPRWSAWPFAKPGWDKRGSHGADYLEAGWCPGWLWPVGEPCWRCRAEILRPCSWLRAPRVADPAIKAWSMSGRFGCWRLVQDMVDSFC